MRADGGEDLLVVAAQSGDERARDRLVADCLPLVYNIIGRALDGHADVDDLVQETLVRAVDGLGGLRDPARFRSWLVAIAMNQVRRHWSRARTGRAVSLDSVEQVPDTGGDFAEVTILRLGLSGQRKEVAQATRWLDDDDRDLLALWWLEAAGRLSRAELTRALESPAAHVAVRVQRMKERLEAGRLIVRALEADPGCTELSRLSSSWDGRPSPLWRKRFARHIRGCSTCSAHGRGLVPPEALLVGLALVPPLLLSVPLPPPAPAFTPTAAHSPSGPDVHLLMHRPPLHKSVWFSAAVAVGVAVTVLSILFWPVSSPPDQQRALTPSAAPPTITPAVPTALPRISTPASPSTPPAPDRSRSRRVEQQVISLVNAQRAKNGCGPVHADPRLHSAAQKHSDDMAARHFFDHTNPDGKGPGERITAAGYPWSAWAENIAAGSPTPPQVMSNWLNSPAHRGNILNCRYRDLGVGVAYGPGGPWWTQDFGTSR
ncbi:sigma-70 family RNA polymerase sigma factor [Actinomadura rupiterrae]|uniref:sigma-70 family RNA polymerase sigma factor n=1 Tax=Actinomadura rupiterrae TaxID=559627 RepID=UPI0020A2D381|nr:sigma-70 family RNA polymerase sigma factor [Actinomadura rupiterrae]MCP2342215.1 RNA polymerase sigma factor (sigma-70 family) [Actinomadura rupiterrae]